MNTLNIECGWKIKGFEHGSFDFSMMEEYLSENDWVDAEVPGDIHADLFKAGVIPDPYYSDNSLRCGWVTEKDWFYYTQFHIDEDFLKGMNSVVFDGIDTFADIWLNGVKLGEADNMFLKYGFVVNEVLRNGRNCLAVLVKSVKHIMRQYPEEGYFGCFNIQRIFVRKAQCHFGWDWAPSFPATGIWGDVKVISRSEGSIEDVCVRASTDGVVFFFIELDVKSNRMKAREKLCEENNDRLNMVTKDADIDENSEILVRIKGNQILEQSVKIRGKKNHCTLRISDPVLWWPNGSGEQYLYEYEIILLNNGMEIDRKIGKFGIREISLDASARDSGGYNFTFHVNDQPLFIKGANWVPLDIMTGTIKREKYEYMLEKARIAGFNMIRVWGGGIYEKDIFYDLCDQKGIMVWQDFMFACSDVPDNQPWFVEKVYPEAEHQVIRLRNHPCIAYWCGGNEKTGNHGALKSYGDRIFHYILRGICGELDPTRPFGPASPYSYTDFGNDEDSGDTHWGVYFHAMQDIKSYRKKLCSSRASFISEFAIQGSARYDSLIRFIPEEKLWPTNDIWDLHLTRNPYDGTGKTFIEQQKRLAAELLGEFVSLKEFVKKSMTLHAEMMKAELEYHRTRKWNCGGAMFWMFSDIWPSSTWAVVDYYGIPKAAYYTIARVCRPIGISIQEREEGLFIYIMNDSFKEHEGNVEIGQKTFSGEIYFTRQLESVSAPANRSVRVEAIPLEYKNQNGTYLYARYYSKGFDCKDIFHITPLHEIEWPDTAVELVLLGTQEYNTGDKCRYVKKFAVRASAYARMVNLTSNQDERLNYSDNYFDLEAGEERVIIVESSKNLDATELRLNHWLTE